MRFDVNVTGAKEIEKQLANLEKKTAKKFVRKSCREGAKSVHPRVSSNAITMVGGKMGNLIARNYRIRTAKKIAKKPGLYAVALEPKPGVPKFVDKNNYIPAAIEYGHGNVPAIPFSRKTAAQSDKSARKIMGDVLIRKIEAEGRKIK